MNIVSFENAGRVVIENDCGPAAPSDFVLFYTAFLRVGDDADALVLGVEDPIVGKEAFDLLVQKDSEAVPL